MSRVAHSIIETNIIVIPFWDFLTLCYIGFIQSAFFDGANQVYSILDNKLKAIKLDRIVRKSRPKSA